MRETIAEYIEAREGYSEATRPPNSHAMPPRVSHGDPRLLRYRTAFDALVRLVACGTCGTPIKADAMTGTTCACAPTIQNDHEGKFVLYEAGALAVLTRHVADLHEGIRYGESIVDMDAAVKATGALAEKARAAVAPYEGDAYARPHIIELEEAIKAFDGRV